MSAALPLPAQSAPVIDLLSLNRPDRELFYAGYRAGITEGIDMGRAQAEAEAELAWSAMAETIRKVGGPFSRPFSQLCDPRRTRASCCRTCPRTPSCSGA